MKKNYDTDDMKMEVKKYENLKLNKEEMDAKYADDMSYWILSKLNKKQLPKKW